jgi:ABC-type transporter Mla subunit MlaD
MAIMGYHFEKITTQTVAVDNFKRSLESEFEAFKETVSRFAKAQSDRIGEIGLQAQELFSRVRAQYEEIHEDFRYNVQDALVSFQKTVFKQYLEAEFGAFKETAARFTQAQGNRIGAIGTHAQELLARVQTQHEQIHHDFRHHVEDTLNSFKTSLKSHLDQLGVPISLEA